MPWDELFDDLDVRFAAERDATRRATAAEGERLRIASLALRDRLRALSDVVVTIETAGGRATGVPAIVGADWCVLHADAGDLLVPLSAIVAISLDASSVPASVLPLPDDEMRARIGFGFAVRALARARTPVTLTRIGAEPLTGTIDRAGADHLDLAVHDADVPRRDRDVRRIVTVPFAAVALLAPAAGFRVPFS